MLDGRTAGAEPGPAIQVAFADARRPEDATHVRMEGFDGPLALLLTLIEQRQLDILTVRLGDLAGAYLEALVGLDRVRLPLLSAFVGVCSQLILIKSRAVLPRAPQTPPPEADLFDPEEDLRRRLLLYRRYRDAGQRLAARLQSGMTLFHREAAVAAAAGLAGARPPEEPPLDPQMLSAALTTSVRLVPPLPAPPQVVPRTITLEDRAALIRDCLRDAPQLVLQDLLADVSDRVVVAVTFLAVLEMAKGREVIVEQDQPWGPIVVRNASSGTADDA